MIRPAADLPRVHLCREPVDMRKSIDGLAALVSHVLKFDPFSSELFVSVNRQRNKLKILAWDRSSFVILYKRLEQEGSTGRRRNPPPRSPSPASN